MRVIILRCDDPPHPTLILDGVERIHSDGTHVSYHRVSYRMDGLRFSSTVRLPLASIAEMALAEDEAVPMER